MDWSVGQTLSSKSERRRLYKQKGMIERSAAEVFREQGTYGTRNAAMSYDGQKDHTSTAERGSVRTKTGQRVV